MENRKSTVSPVEEVKTPTPSKPRFKTPTFVTAQNGSFQKKVIAFNTCGNLVNPCKLSKTGRLKTFQKNNPTSTPGSRKTNLTKNDLTPGRFTDSTMTNSRYSEIIRFSSLVEQNNTLKPEKNCVKSAPRIRERHFGTCSIKRILSNFSQIALDSRKVQVKYDKKVKKRKESELKIYKKVSKTPNVKRTTSPRKAKNNTHLEKVIKEYFGKESPPKTITNQVLDHFSGKLEYLLSSHTNSVNSIEVVNGQLWSAASDYEVRVWNIPFSEKDPYRARGASQSFFNQSKLVGKHKSKVTCVKCEQNTVVTASRDGAVKIWSSNGKLSGNILVTGSVNCAEFLSTEKFTLGGGEGVYIWDLNLRKPFRDNLNEHYKEVLCTEKQSNYTFFSGSRDTTIKLWDLRTVRSLCTYTGHNDIVTSICFKDENKLVSVSHDCKLIEWDIRMNSALEKKDTQERLQVVKLIKGRIVTGGEYLSVCNESKVKWSTLKDIAYCSERNLCFACGFSNDISAWDLEL